MAKNSSPPICNFRTLSSYPSRTCGIGLYAQHIMQQIKKFTSEIGGSKDVTAIDNRHPDNNYGSEVDFVLDQYDPASWSLAVEDINNKALQLGRGKHHTYLNIHFEHGLGGGAWEDNYVSTLKKLKKTDAYKKELLHIVTTLHTLRPEPNDFQKKGICGVCKYSDGVIVMAECGKTILEHKYGITGKDTLIKYLDHGVRMHDVTNEDRRNAKIEWGQNPADKNILSTGLWSKPKGLFKYGVRGYVEAVKRLEKIDPSLRTRLIIPGQCHPDDNEKEAYFGKAMRILDSSGLLLNKNPVENPVPLEALGARRIKGKKHGIFIAYGFVPEKKYPKVIGGADICYFPYLDKQQIVSGQVSDALGIGRDIIATKMLHAVEMLAGLSAFKSIEEILDPSIMPQEGKIIGMGRPDARGLLVDCDKGRSTVSQLGKALFYALTNEEDHEMRADNAHEKGHKMEFKNVAWNTMRFFDFIRKRKERMAA